MQNMRGCNLWLNFKKNVIFIKFQGNKSEVHVPISLVGNMVHLIVVSGNTVCGLICEELEKTRRHNVVCSFDLTVVIRKVH